MVLKHLEFLESPDLFYETEGYLFVHAGLPDIDINELRNDKHVYEEDLLWTMEPFFRSGFNYDKLVIHGHTPYSEFGILMYNIEHKEEVLEVNQKISGIIGDEIYGKIQFEAVVLRCEKNPLESSMP